MKSKFMNLSLAEQDKSRTVKFITDKKSGTTVCRLYDRWADRYFVGVTRCHDVDTFDEKTGRAIAFNKARRKELLTNINELEQSRAFLTAWYEDEMKRIDKRQGLKQIYLMGVEDELNELFGNSEDCPETTQDGVAAEQPSNLKDEKKDNGKVKLTQYSKVKEFA